MFKIRKHSWKFGFCTFAIGYDEQYLKILAFSGKKWLLTLGALQPLIVFLLPEGLEMLGSDNFPATLIKFLSVVIGSGVGSTLVLGVHANLGLNFKLKKWVNLTKKYINGHRFFHAVAKKIRNWLKKKKENKICWIFEKIGIANN